MGLFVFLRQARFRQFVRRRIEIKTRAQKQEAAEETFRLDLQAAIELSQVFIEFDKCG